MDGFQRAGVVAVVAFAGLVAIASVEAGNRPGPFVDDEPAATLVEAWERSRRATFRATGTFTRTAADGRSLSSVAETVQRPPDRLIRQFGEVTGRRDDRVLSCPAPAPARDPAGDPARDPAAADPGTSGDDARPFCSLGPPGESYEQTVVREVAAFAALVDGTGPLYSVTRRSGTCWRMTRTRFDPRSGFGVRADLCFDLSTGAVASIVVDHGDITDRTDFDHITAVVEDDDLEP